MHLIENLDLMNELMLCSYCSYVYKRVCGGGGYGMLKMKPYNILSGLSSFMYLSKISAGWDKLILASYILLIV